MQVSHCFALNFNASNPFCAGNADACLFIAVACNITAMQIALYLCS